MRTIKEMVANNQKVQFVKYLDGNLYYKTECAFEFPVPVTDIGNATFLAEDRAMLFMRYIRKHVDLIGKAKAATEIESKDVIEHCDDCRAEVIGRHSCEYALGV